MTDERRQGESERGLPGGDGDSPRSEPDEQLSRLERRLGYRFLDQSLLEQALIHRSFANERRLQRHNERLEFLGDAVLGLIAAEWLFHRYPERPEGDLARAKAALVSAGPLSRFAESIDLGSLLRLGIGESRSGGSRKVSLLGDALEAVWAAIYLDGGLDPARRAIERYLVWAHGLVEFERSDAKTRLQEWVQARGGELPRYAIVDETGPEHGRTFICEVTVFGEVAGRGIGSTKKEAHQHAAAAALPRLLAREESGTLHAKPAPPSPQVGGRSRPSAGRAESD